MGNGIEAKCCGSKPERYQKCSACGVNLCEDCCTVEEINTTLVRRCDKCRKPQGGSGRGAEKRTIRWSLPEYEAERKRRRVRTDTHVRESDSLTPLSSLPPVSKVVHALLS